MDAAVKIPITIPTNHRLELTLPDDLPAGPAELIILVPLAHVTADGLAKEEASLDAAAEAAVAQDGRFREEGGLLVFMGEIPPELQDELDHRRDREQRLD